MYEGEWKNDKIEGKGIMVKVALNKGKEAFLEAAEILRNLEPLLPLEFIPEMCIPLPEKEGELKDPSFLKLQVKKLKDEGIVEETISQSEKKDNKNIYKHKTGNTAVEEGEENDEELEGSDYSDEDEII